MLGLFFNKKIEVVAKLAQAFHCLPEFKEKEEVSQLDETLFFFYENG